MSMLWRACTPSGWSLRSGAVGGHFPLHSAWQGDARCDVRRSSARYFSGTLHFEITTPKSITSVARLRKDLHPDRAALRYALDDEEAVLGARCIGAAILDANGKVAGGISISGPTARINKANLASIAQDGEIGCARYLHPAWFPPQRTAENLAPAMPGVLLLCCDRP